MHFLNLVLIRLFQTILVIWVVVSIVFIVSRLIGNPTQSLLPFDSTNEEIAELEEKLGLDDPLIVQYGRFIIDAVQLDFGYSFHRTGPAMEQVADKVLGTVKLTMSGLVVALALGLPLGLLAALRRGSPLDWLARVVAVFGQATPSFWLGLMLIFFLATKVSWFPTAGAEGFRSLVLPAIALGLLSAAGFMRLTRSGMIDVMNTDFIRTARAKGLNERTVIIRHGLRHALIPVMTILGLELGRLIAGSVIIEVVFSWPGIGRLMIESILKSDYPTVQAGVAVIAGSIAFGNLLVDLSYRFIDPRIRVAEL
jgi:ABC-type dipeptide/oligopeptide/nickel transport system permease component